MQTPITGGTERQRLNHAADCTPTRPRKSKLLEHLRTHQQGAIRIRLMGRTDMDHAARTGQHLHQPRELGTPRIDIDLVHLDGCAADRNRLTNEVAQGCLVFESRRW